MAFSASSGSTLPAGQAQMFPTGMLPNPVAWFPSSFSTVTSTLISFEVDITRPPNLSGVLKGQGSKEMRVSMTRISDGLDMTSRLIEGRKSAQLNLPILCRKSL